MMNFCRQSPLDEGRGGSPVPKADREITVGLPRLWFRRSDSAPSDFD